MSASKKQKICLQNKNNLQKKKLDYSRFLTLETLPPELLEMIMRFLPLHDVSSIIRLVSRYNFFYFIFKKEKWKYFIFFKYLSIEITYTF